MPRVCLLLFAWFVLPTAIFANVTPAQLGEFLLKTKYKGVRANYLTVIRGVGGGFHAGIDYHAAKGTMVYSPVKGRVHSVDARRGRVSIVVDGTREFFILMHLSSIGVAPGRVVQVGQYLGKSGSNATLAAHLHVELRTNTPHPSPNFKASNRPGSNKNPVLAVYAAPSGFNIPVKSDASGNINWIRTAGVSKYHIQITSAATGWHVLNGWKTGLIANKAVTTPLYEWENFQAGKTYWYSVRQFSPVRGWSVFSTPRSFVPSTYIYSTGSGSVRIGNANYSLVATHASNGELVFRTQNPDGTIGTTVLPTTDPDNSSTAASNDPGRTITTGGSLTLQTIDTITLTGSFTPAYTWNAEPLPVDGSVSSNLQTVSSSNIYRITLNDASSLVLQGSTSQGASLTHNTTVWNANGQPVTLNYNSTDGSSATSTLELGTYFIRIDGSTNLTGNYKLNVTTVP